MSSNTEPLVLSDVIKMEGPNYYSRDILTAGDGSVLNIGFVAMLSGTGSGTRMIRCSATASATAICLENLGTLTEDTSAIFAVRHCMYDANNVNYNSLSAAPIDARFKVLGMIKQVEPATLDTQTT